MGLAQIVGQFLELAARQLRRDPRLARLRRRDGLSGAELRRRAAAQLPLAAKARRADVIIVNDGSRAELRRRVQEYHRALELMYGG